MAFSPSWNIKAQVGNRSHIGTAPDPLHAVTSAHDMATAGAQGPESWLTTGTNPGTVSLVVEDGTVLAAGVGGGGPVDATPVDHVTGDGVGAGLSDEASARENAAWRSTDYGATNARRWQAPQFVDGRQVTERLAEQAPTGIWGSPETVMLKAGTNPEAYPNGQRTGHRIHRWRDRVYDRRGYTPDHRPLYTPNAFSAPDVSAGMGGYASPYPQMGHVNVLMEQAPQLRRVPTSWSDPVVTDPTSNPGYYDPPADVWGM